MTDDIEALHKKISDLTEYLDAYKRLWVMASNSERKLAKVVDMLALELRTNIVMNYPTEVRAETRIALDEYDELVRHD